ncbi:DUF1796 family putative cysteine peptidase [Klebsiella aerogenes]|uniref:DUF1796 family putative cysteine peptidase n=1 Tax=Klebsiella aerogenes TaxID=548 RepID=UPI00379684BD
MLQSIKKIKNKVEKKYHLHMCKKNQDEKTVWLSLGENCLPDDILNRFHLKSYSSPFASCRSNIDYIISMHENNYNGLLDIKNSINGVILGKNVLRSSIYNKCHPVYHDLHINGFEFTHHNWAVNKNIKSSLQRRIDRFKKDIGTKNIILLYHHRKTNKSDIEYIIKRLSEFSNKLTTNGMECTIALFYQELVQCRKDRKLIKRYPSDNVYEYEFRTQNTWEGDDEKIFWGKIDDDLIKNMIFDIKSKKI